MDVSPLPAQVDGDGVLLRLWQESDVPALAALVERNLEHLRPWMPWIAAEPLSTTQRTDLVRQWQEQWQNGEDAVYGIFLGGEPIGGTGLHRRRGAHGLEIGYWVDVAHCGQGVATRAARTLTAAALAQPGITFVEIHHDKANQASARVPAKLGYTLVGESPDHVDAPGEVGIDCAWRFTATAGHPAP